MGLVRFQEHGDSHGEEHVSLSHHNITITNNDFNETRRYVFTCAIFASLNSVLLGYGIFSISLYRSPSI